MTALDRKRERLALVQTLELLALPMPNLLLLVPRLRRHLELLDVLCEHKTCPGCGVTFWATYSGKKVCSAACRNKLHRRRLKEAGR